MPSLLSAMFKVRFWIGNPIEAYTDAYINFVKPKLVLTYIDNNVNFYSISNRFPSFKTIFVQNGTRAEIGDVFGHLKKNKKNHVDYMLVHGQVVGRHYGNLISGKIIPIGSFKNNQIQNVSRKKDSGSILFISQLMQKIGDGRNLCYAVDGDPVSWDEFFQAEIHVLSLLKKWCKQNSKVIKVCGRWPESQEFEKDFYSVQLVGCEWEYIPKASASSPYNLVDSSEVTVFIDSTLGYEALARGARVACFSCRAITLKAKSCNFGWPGNYPDEGLFWNNFPGASELNNVMSSVSKMGDGEWAKIVSDFSPDLMVLDAGNRIFSELIGQQLEV